MTDNKYLDYDGLQYLLVKVLNRCEQYVDDNRNSAYIKNNAISFSSSSINLDPNSYYILTTPQNSLSITLADPEDEDIVNHYFLEFPYNGGSVTFPSNLLWLNGEIPSLTVGYNYQLSIVNNNALIRGWQQ
jgi:hypothetical protein